MTFKKLFSICVFILGAGALYNTCASALKPAQPVNAPAKAVRADPAVTLSPTPTAIVLTAPTGEPVRVRFERGSYGATLTGNGSTRYLLEARAGQVFTTALIGSGYTSLYSVDGKALYEQAWNGGVVTATLAVNGDQVLEIRASGAYTVGVQIR